MTTFSILHAHWAVKWINKCAVSNKSISGILLNALNLTSLVYYYSITMYPKCLLKLKKYWYNWMKFDPTWSKSTKFVLEIVVVYKSTLNSRCLAKFWKCFIWCCSFIDLEKSLPRSFILQGHIRTGKNFSKLINEQYQIKEFTEFTFK